MQSHCVLDDADDHEKEARQHEREEEDVIVQFTRPGEFWQFAAVVNWMAVFGPMVDLEVDVNKLERSIQSFHVYPEPLTSIHLTLLRGMSKKQSMITVETWPKSLKTFVRNNWADMWTVRDTPLLSADLKVIADTDYSDLHPEFRLCILHELCIAVMKLPGQFKDLLHPIIQRGKASLLRLPPLGRYRQLENGRGCQYWLPCASSPQLFASVEAEASDGEDWVTVSTTEEQLIDFSKKLQSNLDVEKKKKGKSAGQRRGRGRGKARGRTNGRRHGRESASATAALIKEGVELLEILKSIVETCREARIKKEEAEAAATERKQRQERKMMLLRSSGIGWRNEIQEGTRRKRNINYADDQNDDFLDEILEDVPSEQDSPQSMETNIKGATLTRTSSRRFLLKIPKPNATSGDPAPERCDHVGRNSTNSSDDLNNIPGMTSDLENDSTKRHREKTVSYTKSYPDERGARGSDNESGRDEFRRDQETKISFRESGCENFEQFEDTRSDVDNRSKSQFHNATRSVHIVGENYKPHHLSYMKRAKIAPPQLASQIEYVDDDIEDDVELSSQVSDEDSDYIINEQEQEDEEEDLYQSDIASIESSEHTSDKRKRKRKPKVISNDSLTVKRTERNRSKNWYGDESSMNDSGSPMLSELSSYDSDGEDWK
eukprot:CFRG1905T1